MRTRLILSLPVALLIGASCSSSKGSGPAPAAAPTPTAAAPAAGRGAAPAGGAAQAPAGGRAGAPAAAAAGAGAGGRQGAPQLTLEQRQARADSIAAKRAATVRELMATIAGKENQPAGEVFKNVQLMKTVPAGQFLTAMDQGIGRGLGRDCGDCHLAGDYASDSLARKKTARTMMGIVNDINATLLPRMGPGRGGAPRTIQCLTCHRGGQAGRNVAIP
jgi:hypothetical protein